MEIGGKKVVASGSVVVPRGQPLTFHPFPNDQKFKLVVDVELNKDMKPVGIRIASNDDPGSASLKVTGGYSDGIHVANNDPLKFASDADKTYYGNFSIMCVGAYEAFTSIVSYSILEVDKS